MHPARIIVLFAALGSAALATEPQPVHRIEILADVPTVAVAPRRPGRFAMRLPSLNYELTMTANCDEDWRPDSVSVSVADSSKSFDAEQLQVGDSIEFDLQIPATQIGPLRLEHFCISDEDFIAANEAKITIESVLSAQASLLCATDTERTIRYVTVPLDVSLECVRPETGD
jgi:hypothetical protein